jgi:hypothetical protein
VDLISTPPYAVLAVPFICRQYHKFCAWLVLVTGITMGGQKVPGMVVLHCNGRTYGNAYLITLKVGPLSTHTLLLHRSAIVGSTGGRLLLEYAGVQPSHSI